MEHLRTSGFVLFVALLVVEGKNVLNLYIKFKAYSLRAKILLAKHCFWISILLLQTFSLFSCNRYKEGHAIRHWKETQHCYSLELETQRVWDYVGDNYVHRLIQSKTDGKLVELNFHCTYADHLCGTCECTADSGINEALYNSKVDNVIFYPLKILF